ncbi:hypothetical protein AVEN_138319-1 [Araneus ventricosus]|uniref:Tc1-like transposase DDE domain-containing protein n=1 Tax=Araneus ventricosus TaxID=182803 RepID=A0A4Y2J2S6_ARAVE|nr:hypothetical protein AVEN_138319-1 [Araneus ventricosus]
MAVAHRTAPAAEIRAAVGTTVTQRTVTNRLLQGQLRAKRPIACIPLTPILCRLRPGSALVPVIAVCRFEGGQVSACNQPVCGLDTLDVHLELWSGEQFPMTAGALCRSTHASWTANLYVSLVIQPGVLPFMNSIRRGVFQQDNARPHTPVVIQHALQSVDMLPWPARSPDLSPIEHVWDIIGRQLQRHPQTALTVPVLTYQVKQPWNSIPQTDIRHLYDTMHARLHACIQNAGDYTGY